MKAGLLIGAAVAAVAGAESTPKATQLFNESAATLYALLPRSAPLPLPPLTS